MSTTRASTHWAPERVSVLTRVWGWQMVWMCESGSGAGKTPRVFNSVLFVRNECGKCVKGWLLSSVPHTKSTACVLYCVISQQPSHQWTLSINRKEAEPQFDKWFCPLPVYTSDFIYLLSLGEQWILHVGKQPVNADRHQHPHPYRCVQHLQHRRNVHSVFIHSEFKCTQNLMWFECESVLWQKLWESRTHRADFFPFESQSC